MAIFLTSVNRILLCLAKMPSVMENDLILDRARSSARDVLIRKRWSFRMECECGDLELVARSNRHTSPFAYTVGYLQLDEAKVQAARSWR